MAGRAWTVPAIRNARPGALPFYALLFVEVATISWLFPRRTATPWLPKRWSLLGFAGLLGALACNALGLALISWKAPVWHAPPSGLEFVSGGLLDPIVEEWIFRGVLWRLATDALEGHGSTIAALIAGVFTAVLFGFWHFPFAEHPAVVANIIFGAFLALARWRFNAIGPGVIVHALGNSYFLLAG